MKRLEDSGNTGTGSCVHRMREEKWERARNGKKRKKRDFIISRRNGSAEADETGNFSRAETGNGFGEHLERTYTRTIVPGSRKKLSG